MVEVEPQEGMRAVSVHFTVTASGRGRGGGGQVFGWPEQADAQPPHPSRCTVKIRDTLLSIKPPQSQTRPSRASHCMSGFSPGECPAPFPLVVGPLQGLL